MLPTLDISSIITACLPQLAYKAANQLAHCKSACHVIYNIIKYPYQWTEFRAGTATFMTMAYILAVNASIVSDTGGPCIEEGFIPDRTNDDLFLPFLDCQSIVRRDLVTATAASAGIATFLMGILANLPLGLAPGMFSCRSCTWQSFTTRELAVDSIVSVLVALPYI